MSVTLKPADIFLTRGSGFVSRAIRFFTRRIGEKRTKVNHVGLVVKGGSLRHAVVVEALSSVKRHRLWNQYGPPSTDLVTVYRAKNLSDKEIKMIVAKAETYVGRKYGYFKILAHLADWFLLGAYRFRKFTRMDKYPICSWVVAHSFKVAGKNFEVDAGAASPDDIWDFVTRENEPEKPKFYEQIYPLKPLA